MTITVDLDRYFLTYDGRSVRPTRAVMIVVAMLSARPSMVFTNEVILSHLPEGRQGAAPRVKETIVRVWKALRELDPDHDYIINHYDTGYQWRTK